MTAFLDAVAFLTRLPVASRRFDLARAIRFFPIVGAGLGLLQWTVVASLVAVAAVLAVPAPPWLLAGAIVLCNVWITGAMHLDALADSADGLGGGHTREDILRIMRDHAVGSYGAVALIVGLGLRSVALVEIVDHEGFAWLVVAPTLSRMTPGMMALMLPAARREGLGSALAGKVSAADVTLGTAVAVGVVSSSIGTMPAMIAVLTTVVVMLGMSELCRRRLGGMTGDTMGATIEICEVAVLLVGAVAVSG